MVDSIEEPNSTASLPDFLRYSLSILKLVAIYPADINDRNLVGLNRRVRLEIDYLAISEGER